MNEYKKQIINILLLVPDLNNIESPSFKYSKTLIEYKNLINKLNNLHILTYLDLPKIERMFTLKERLIDISELIDREKNPSKELSNLYTSLTKKYSSLAIQYYF